MQFLEVTPDKKVVWARQELFTRQSPQRLKVLREHALIEGAVSSNRIEGVTVHRMREQFFLHRLRQLVELAVEGAVKQDRPTHKAMMRLKAYAV